MVLAMAENHRIWHGGGAVGRICGAFIGGRARKGKPEWNEPGPFTSKVNESRNCPLGRLPSAGGLAAAGGVDLFLQVGKPHRADHDLGTDHIARGSAEP